MNPRQQKLPLTSRIVAVGCAVIWLVAVSACNLEALCCCDSQDSETAATANPASSRGAETVAVTHHAHDADAQALPDADGHSHDSTPHNRSEGLCCSMLYAVTHSANPIVFTKSPSYPISVLDVLLEAQFPTHAVRYQPRNRIAKSYDRVLTPEVCLGPAHRSLAPPTVCAI